ncbi:hypothetical protein A0H81_14499 [Grifola frondosa]|uniref:Uncharacterized protein n=1 Tax=Grifola frondosa TaxID=5627 RepID=A0A1C7LLH3_GRIFR|nr:hypothetical protein A0H81_14499 [Grifola frondosa]
MGKNVGNFINPRWKRTFAIHGYLMISNIVSPYSGLRSQGQGRGEKWGLLQKFSAPESLLIRWSHPPSCIDTEQALSRKQRQMLVAASTSTNWEDRLIKSSSDSSKSDHVSKTLSTTNEPVFIPRYRVPLGVIRNSTFPLRHTATRTSPYSIMAASMIEVDESEHLDMSSLACPPNFSSFPSHHHPIKFVSLQLRAAHDHPAERRFFRRARMQARSSSQRRRGSDAMDVESAPIPTPTAPSPPLAVFGMPGVSTAISESGMSFRDVDDDEDMERDSHPAETVAQSQLSLAQRPQAIDEDDDMLADTGVAPSPAVVRNQPETPSKVHETPSKPSESSPEPNEVAKLNDTPPKVATPSQTTSSANGGESVDKTNKMETKVDEVRKWTRPSKWMRRSQRQPDDSSCRGAIAACPDCCGGRNDSSGRAGGFLTDTAAPQVPMDMAKMRQETWKISKGSSSKHSGGSGCRVSLHSTCIIECPSRAAVAGCPSHPASLMSSVERDPSRIPYEAKGKWVDRRSAGKLPSQSPRTTAPHRDQAAQRQLMRSGALAPPSRSSSPSTSQSVLDEAFRLSKEAQGKGNSSMPPPSTKATPATRVFLPGLHNHYFQTRIRASPN